MNLLTRPRRKGFRSTKPKVASRECRSRSQAPDGNASAPAVQCCRHALQAVRSLAAAAEHVPLSFVHILSGFAADAPEHLRRCMGKAGCGEDGCSSTAVYRLAAEFTCIAHCWKKIDAAIREAAQVAQIASPFSGELSFEQRAPCSCSLRWAWPTTSQVCRSSCQRGRITDLVFVGFR